MYVLTNERILSFEQTENIMLKAKWGDTEVTEMSKITQEKISI